MKNLFRLSCLLFVGVPVALAAPAWAQSAAETATDKCGHSTIDYVDEEGLTLEEKIRRMDLALTRSLNRYDECQLSQDDALETETNDPAEAAAESESGGGAESESAASDQAAAEAESGESAAASPGDISGNEADPATAPSVSALPSLSPPPSETQGISDGQAGSSQGDLEGDEVGAPNIGGSSSTAAGDIAGDEPDPALTQQARRSGTGRQQDPEQAGPAGGSGEGTVAGTGTQVMNNGKLPEDIPPADNDSVLERQIRQAAIDEPDPELKKKLWNEYRRYKGLPQVK